MRRLLVPIAALALLTTACGSSGNGSSSAAGSGSAAAGPTAVSVGVIPIVDVAPIYLGKEKGFFANRGIDLNLVQTTGGAASVPGVIAGDFQYSFANITSVLLASSTGLPLKVIAEGNSSTGDAAKDFGGIVVPPGSPIASPKDLVGKTIAVNNLKNIGEVTVRKAVEDDGGDSSKVKFAELAFPDMPAALATKQVDAAWLVEPFFTVAKQAGNTLISSNLATTAPNMTIGTYFTTDQQIKKNPQLTKNFQAAIQESLQYSSDHPEEVRRILLTYTKIAPAVAAQITLPAFPQAVNKESVQTVADLMVKYGMATKKPDVDAVLSQG
jgi:NitT/TauT family transport system substrate-binding protein